MFGSDSSFRTFGIAPLSLHWIYKLIDEKSKNDGFLADKFSIALSAVEINHEEKIRDLLDAKDLEIDSSRPMLSQLRQLKAECAQKAVECLDMALNARKGNDYSHVIVSLIVYKYKSKDTYDGEISF